MSRRRKHARAIRSTATKCAASPKPPSAFVADGPLDAAVRYAEACGLAAQGRNDDARRIYAELDAVLAGAQSEPRVRALIRSDLAAIAAIEGRFDEALAGWRAAIEIDPDCLMARLNRDLIEAELSFGRMSGDLGELKLAPAPGPSPLVGEVATVPSLLVGEGGPKGRMGGGAGPGNADPHLAGVNGNAPPHPPFGHPLPERGEGEDGRMGGGVGLGRTDLRLEQAFSDADPHLPFGHPLPRGEGEFGTAGRGLSGGPVRVAILSFLFNWPSTGGGNHHTAELAAFLGRAGYEVKHFFAQFPSWGIGRITNALISPSEAIAFDDANWNVAAIQTRFRQAVDAFAPDYVMITDAWNMKPYLAEAMRGYPYYLLYQAQENICPLNNLRLLATGPNEVEQCPRNQLATPDVCCRCLAERGRHSGALHRAERELAGVGTQEYYAKLRQSLSDAEAVLVLNPVIAALVEPYCSRVRIVPWGMDKSRFPWPVPEGERASALGAGLTTPPTERPEVSRAFDGPDAPDANKAVAGRRPTVSGEGGVVRPAPSASVTPAPAANRTTLFMAAVAGETIKGYHVAHDACRILRQSRADFELVVTFDSAGPIDEFTRSGGWCSLSELPRYYREADICLVPTIAQDSLSRTSVEAMASGIPVIASRIGGLPYTVNDGVTGLLFEPGDPADLASKIGRLLDDPELRHRMGLAGRKRFEDDFEWDDVIERYFRPLLARRHAGAAAY